MNPPHFRLSRAMLQVAMQGDSPPLSNQPDGAKARIAAAADIRDLPIDDVLSLMSPQLGGRVPDQSVSEPRTDTDHAQPEWADFQSLSTTIIEADASAADMDPNRMEPLDERCDPDTQDALFSPLSDDVPHTNGQALFTFASQGVADQSSGNTIVTVSETERKGERFRIGFYREGALTQNEILCSL